LGVQPPKTYNYRSQPAALATIMRRRG
jgi:hypothetical protein